MSSELINRISIKKDGVYVSTHSNNDTSPYHSCKIEYLTEIYKEKGQFELDKEIINMCFYNCQLRGTHKSVLPFINAIDKALADKEFLKIKNEYARLDDKAFYIVNRFDGYKNLTKEESQKMYDNLKPELDRLRNKRNEYVANLVSIERGKILGPKELKEGIYEVIPIHRVDEGHGEIYTEYMNFNSNNGTIIYEYRLGNLMPSPDTISISEYQEKINKMGIENINGAKEFKNFIQKYPDIYIVGVENELKEREKKQEQEEEETL